MKRHLFPLALVLSIADTGLAQIRSPFPRPRQPGVGQQGADETRKTPRERLLDRLQQRLSPLAPIPRFDQPIYRRGFQGVESVFPIYQGFPFPPGSTTAAGGFGAYPRAAQPGTTGLPGRGRQPALGGFPILPGPKKVIDTGRPQWPSWMRVTRTAAGTFSSPERAVVARVADRVWYLAPGETAYVPLAFYDKFRLVESGGRLRVRNKGEFQVAFHDGGSLRSLGPVRLTFAGLSREAAELELEDLHRIWIVARSRPLRLGLPDGSRFVARNARLYLERAETERAWLLNEGPDVIEWTSPIGRRELAPGRRLDFFLAPRTRPYLPAELVVEGSVSTERKGRVVAFQSEGARARVSWCGARFSLVPGVRLVLDPLAGNTFPMGSKTGEKAPAAGSAGKGR